MTRAKMIKEKGAALCCRSYIFVKNLKGNIKEKIIKSTQGMGTIEVIIIIAVLVALALIFRTFIGNISTKIFNKIQEKTDSAMEDL